MTDLAAETTADRWARLTAPLDTSPPVILTPAARAAWAQLTDDLHAQRATDQDLLDAWYQDAVLATFGPLDGWLHLFPPPPPAMMP